MSRDPSIRLSPTWDGQPRITCEAGAPPCVHVTQPNPCGPFKIVDEFTGFECETWQPGLVLSHIGPRELVDLAQLATDARFAEPFEGIDKTVVAADWVPSDKALFVDPGTGRVEAVISLTDPDLPEP